MFSLEKLFNQLQSFFDKCNEENGNNIFIGKEDFLNLICLCDINKIEYDQILLEHAIIKFGYYELKINCFNFLVIRFVFRFF